MAEAAELLLKICPQHGPAILAGTIQRMLRLLLIGDGDGYGSTAVTAAYTLVIGRVLSFAAQMFWEILSQVAVESGTTIAALLGNMLDLWLSHLSTVCKVTDFQAQLLHAIRNVPHVLRIL